jgi:hypothetical protein
MLAREMKSAIRPSSPATLVLTALGAIATMTACSVSQPQEQTSDFVDARSPATLIIGGEFEANQEVAGDRHQLRWMATGDCLLMASGHEVVLRLPDDSTILVQLNEHEHLTPDPTQPLVTSAPLLQLQRGLGNVTIWHAGHDAKQPSAKLVDLLFYPEARQAIRGAGWQVTGLEALRLLLLDVAADDLLAYHKVDDNVTLRLATALAQHRIPVADYDAFGTATNFDDLEVIGLLDRGIDLAFAAAWYEHGNELSAEELAYSHVRSLTPELMESWHAVGLSPSLEKLYWAQVRSIQPELHAAWQAAGHPLSMELLYWVQVRNIKPSHYQAWARAGLPLDHEQLYWARTRNLEASTWQRWSAAGKPLTLERLYWARVRGLTPEAYVAWRAIGYDLPLEELQETRVHGIDARIAAAWHTLGFRWSLEELKTLQQNGITPSFGGRYVDPAFENPTVRELKHYRLHSLKPEDVKQQRAVRA